MLKTVTNIINASQIQTPITLPGDVTLSTGNLVIGTSGKGVDFSATSGTGTSELLNDYEEGTWTPNQGSGLTVVGAFSSSGTYTKIGRFVIVRGQVSGSTSVAAAPSSLICTNLPFTVASGQSCTGGSCNDSVSASTTTLAANALLFTVQAMAATPGIGFSVTYQV